MHRLALTTVVAIGCSRAAPAPGKVEVLTAPAEGDVAPWIAAAVDARGDRQVVVYVGAAWCEPCRYFHDAVAAGRLDRRFPRLTLLEFDADRDDDRLAAAGYRSRMIPLLARVGRDGRADGHQLEGSIKGPEAVDQIIPRLEALLAQ